MKVIFLDVDGVLNYEGTTKGLLDDSFLVQNEKLALLQELVNVTGADLVLSSSWRRGWTESIVEGEGKRFNIEESKPYFMLCAKLHDYGLSLLSETPRLQGRSREDSIRYWLNEWPGEEIESFVIFDDDPTYFTPNNPHLILTDPHKGLTSEAVEQAKKILNTTTYRILVVDDTELNRAIIRNDLEHDYTILEARNGREAVSILESDSNIDMVITDIQMPEMDGIKLIRYIRSKLEYSHISIIANTQYGDPQQEEEIIEIGADEFIYKPSSPKMIRIRVAHTLQYKK